MAEVAIFVVFPVRRVGPHSSRRAHFQTLQRLKVITDRAHVREEEGAARGTAAVDMVFMPQS